MFLNRKLNDTLCTCFKCYFLVPLDSLSRLGSTEHDKFCESFEIVVKDTTLPIPQQDILNILEPWRKVCMIDEDLLVCFAVHAPSFNFVQSHFCPPPNCSFFKGR